MTEKNNQQEQDWRFGGQEKFLFGVKLHLKTYRRYHESWDHDHCAFCWAKFIDADYPDVLRAGYVTDDDYTWVCETCFNDFKDRFQWVVKDENKSWGGVNKTVGANGNSPNGLRRNNY